MQKFRLLPTQIVEAPTLRGVSLFPVCLLTEQLTLFARNVRIPRIPGAWSVEPVN